MSGQASEPVHNSPAEWAAEHLVDRDGRPLELQPWQRQLIDQAFPAVLAQPRVPDRDKTSLAAAVSVAVFGDVVVWSGPGTYAAARRVYAQARALVERRR